MKPYLGIARKMSEPLKVILRTIAQVQVTLLFLFSVYKIYKPEADMYLFLAEIIFGTAVFTFFCLELLDIDDQKNT